MASDIERPNIRVEIQNDLLEEMEVDEEEGEIVDNLPEAINPKNGSVEANKEKGEPKNHFATGIDIFDKNEQKKLEKRAQRFALKPNEIHIFTQEHLNFLHASLGINPNNENKVRFEAIHVIGCENMNTQDVIEYFAEYVPSSIEWINKDSCNVVWLDKISTARALHYISKSVLGMPVRIDNIMEDTFISSMENEDVGLTNKNREVELKEDDASLTGMDIENSVDLSAINISIPPGYWRLGKVTPKAKSLLMRFSFKIDQTPYKTEDCSTYYKKNVDSIFGHKNSNKNDRGIFSRNKQIDMEKDPWGSLAANWYEDARFCEKEEFFHKEEKPKQEDARAKLKAKRRLAVKPASPEPDAESEASEDETKTEKKSKVPRMRMYADDEEEKIKRQRLLQKIKKQSDVIEKDEIESSDLRNILRITNRTSIRSVADKIQMSGDLGLTLRNRNRNILFSIKQEEPFEESESEESEINTAVDIPKRKPPSPIHCMRSDEIPKRNFRERVLVHRKRPHSRERHRERRERRRTPERYHGRMHSSRSSRRDLSERLDLQKPRSKVAVVIKSQVPKVASVVQSRRYKRDSSSEDSSSEDSKSSSSDSESKSSSDSSGSTSSSENGSSDEGFKRNYRNPIR